MTKINKKGKEISDKQLSKAKAVTVKSTNLSSRKRNNVADKCLKGVKKTKTSTDCMITDIENVIGPNRTTWPEYRYYQVHQAWQENACSRMGINIPGVTNCTKTVNISI